MCERELETVQNCNILTPTLMAITAFLSRSPGLLNRGPGGRAFWVLVFSTASYLQLIWSPTAQLGVPRAPSAECCFLYGIISPTLRSPNCFNFLCTELYNSSTPTQCLPINSQKNIHFRCLWNGMFWSSSSGNNCHTVHRSPSSGASFCDCIEWF